MKAVILAGGKGTRLKPYTTVIPKPLVPVGGRAVIDILLSRLKKHGVTEVILCVNHLAELIKAFCQDGHRWGIKVRYSLEKETLSTVAPIKLVENLPKNFIVVNGDLLTDLNFREIYQYHLKSKALLTVGAYQRKVKVDFGILESDPKNKVVVGFREKPEYDLQVMMGISVFNRQVLDFVPKNTPFGIDNLITKLLEEKQTIKVFPYHGYWLDIGRPDDYEKANEDIKEPKLFKKLNS